MNVFGKFDEIPSLILQDINKTKCYGHTFVRSFVWTDVKTVYPPTNTVCRGYNYVTYYKTNIVYYISPAKTHSSLGVYPNCSKTLHIISMKNAYRNDPKFLDRQFSANSADPDQTAPRGAV